MAIVDVVIVSYNSREELRQCVEPLASLEGLNMIVVDNDSPDRSLETIADLPVERLPLDANRGFAVGCNVGWRAGNVPYVLFLNPDAQIDRESIGELVHAIEADPRIGAVGPRIVKRDGSLERSQHRFPRLGSTFAQAVFLHRLFPRASWSSEDVLDEAAYREPGNVEWLGGACLLVRRSLLEMLDGFDEGFFMYSEDIDLCRRVRDAGFLVRFEPSAVAVHKGGASAPRPEMLSLLAASRIRYARKHRGKVGALVERLGIGLGALMRIALARGGREVRAGYARSLFHIATDAHRRTYPHG